jgi:hypothetical protein
MRTLFEDLKADEISFRAYLQRIIEQGEVAGGPDVIIPRFKAYMEKLARN